MINRHPAAQAASAFLFASLARVSALRFVVAIALGLILTAVTVVLLELGELRGDLAGRAPAGVLTVPFTAMAFLLVGLRIAVAMPGDVRAAWMIDVLDPPRHALRSGTWRALWIIGVVPIALVTWIGFWILGSVQTATLHVALCAAMATLLVEALLFRFADVPCSRPWRPERARLRSLWPIYLIGSGLTMSAFSWAAVTVFGSVVRTAIAIGVLGLATALMRLAHRARPLPSCRRDEEPEGPQLLNLS